MCCTIRGNTVNIIEKMYLLCHCLHVSMPMLACSAINKESFAEAAVSRNVLWTNSTAEAKVN